MEIILTATRQNPNTSVTIGDDATEIIVRIGRSIDLGFFPLDAIHRLRRPRRQGFAFITWL